MKELYSTKWHGNAYVQKCHERHEIPQWHIHLQSELLLEVK